MKPSLKYPITLFFLAFMLFGDPTHISAQSNFPDSSFQKQFNAFNIAIRKDFNNFRQHNDSLFLQFLAQSWKEFEGVHNKIPDIPEPITPPTYKAPETPSEPATPKADSLKPGLNVQPKAIEPPEQIIPDTIPQPIPIQLEPIEEEQPVPIKTESIPDPAVISMSAPVTSIEYYGTDFNIPAISQGLPTLSAISKQGIISYFAAASGSSILNTAAQTLKKEAANCRLNDWGLANLFMKAAQKIYPRRNDQVMFTWFALLRSGFNVKVGYDERNVFLLLPANEKLYEMSYTVKDRQYYLLNFGQGQAEPESLSIHDADYPQAITGLSFMITQTPELANLFTNRTLVFSRSLELKLNRNLIDFYNSYPQCELKVFFTAPLSANAIRQLDAYFIPALGNKNDNDRVAFLLKFVHEAIRYQTDGQQFGHEKYFFADETLYYPAADCEDRAVFLAKLINRYTSCKVIGLSYPTHVSLAVNLAPMAYGKYIMYKNLPYYHCDPTYIGSICGMPMPDFENTTPHIIDYAP